MQYCYQTKDETLLSCFIENSMPVTPHTHTHTHTQDLTYRPDTTQEYTEDRKRPLEEVPSFFCWFTEIDPSDDAAEFIKDDIWPNPLQYYFVSFSNGLVHFIKNFPVELQGVP